MEEIRSDMSEGAQRRRGRRIAPTNKETKPDRKLNQNPIRIHQNHLQIQKQTLALRLLTICSISGGVCVCLSVCEGVCESVSPDDAFTATSLITVKLKSFLQTEDFLLSAFRE